MSEEICSVTLIGYPEEVVLSNSRRKKYFKSTNIKYIPKKYLNNNYEFIDGFLVETATGERVIANPKVAGKPKTIPINGQKSYQGMNVHTRAKIVRTLKDYFKENFKYFFKEVNIRKEHYPIEIEMLFFKTGLNNANYDLDNMSFFYRKCCNDALVELKIIEDDSVKYVRSNPCKIVESDFQALEITINRL